MRQRDGAFLLTCFPAFGYTVPGNLKLGRASGSGYSEETLDPYCWRPIMQVEWAYLRSS